MWLCGSVSEFCLHKSWFHFPYIKGINRSLYYGVFYHDMVPPTDVRCSSNPTVVLHLLAPSQPESQLRSTKPEPIVTCGCTGKLPGMKYSSVSLSLGEAFRKMSWRFSMHPGQPLVSPGCPSTVLHPVVCIEFLSRVSKSRGVLKMQSLPVPS